MAVSLCCRRFQLHVRNRLTQQYRKGYVVLLPEISPNIPDQSPLLKDGMPNFAEITTEKCINTLGKHLLEFEHQVHTLTTQLSIPDEKDQPAPVFIKKVAEPLQRMGIPLSITWGIAKTLYLADTSRMPFNSYIPLHTRAHQASCSKYNSASIHKASEECDLEKLTEEEQRLVERYRLEGRLNGLKLDVKEKEKLDIYRKKLSLEKTDFKRRVSIGKDFFASVIHDPYVVQGFPEILLQQIAKDSNEPSRGPWVLSTDPHIRNTFLEYCPDRNLRHTIWKNAMRVASSEQAASELNNSSCLEKIRDLRFNEAETLGYPHYGALSMETKMASSVENVFSVLEVLRQKAKPAHDKEVKELQEFVVKSGSREKLQLADIPYWRRKNRKVLHNFENEELREYFPLEKVFAGMMDLCKRLFDVSFKVVDSVSTWHEDVKFYHVYEGDNSRPVAGFYFDPYSRKSKIPAGAQSEWVTVIRPAHILEVDSPAIPLSAFIMNLPPPNYGKPSLLSFSEVEAFFGQFGKLLQQLLCSVTYADVSGFSNVEWDTTDVSSNFMKHWLYNEKVLKSISGHYSTGAEIPVKDIHLVPHHMAGTELCSQLYKATLDLKLFTEKKEFWMSLVKELWPEYSAFPLPATYYELLSMTDIIASDWSAAFYSQIWSKMIAADIYNAFSEVEGGGDISEIDEASIGARFRGTYLAFGGGCDPHEVFRRFRGRDPSPNAYLRHLGLL